MVSDERSALQRLVDKDSIQDLVHESSNRVDHRRYDDVVELFTSDCVVDFGPFTSPVRSRSDLRGCSETHAGNSWPRVITTPTCS
jgi:hypothetical protein